jgi:hypothetical protein
MQLAFYSSRDQRLEDVTGAREREFINLRD